MDVNGVSSTTSAELLTKQGFEKVYVLKDGLAAWAGANLPLVKKNISKDPLCLNKINNLK